MATKKSDKSSAVVAAPTIEKTLSPTRDDTQEFTASNYRISTITVTGGINSNVCLERLYKAFSGHTPVEITYLEYGSNKHNLLTTGEKTRKGSKGKKAGEKKVTKRFDNQLTIVMTYQENRYNMKLFKNGNIQITGVKTICNGKKAIDFLIEQIKHVYAKHDAEILEDVSSLRNVNYSIRLINSDFRINFEIRLDYLYRVVVNQYSIICSYEPCIYPGAKIEYYYPNNGYCKCTGFCNGKSAACKKITIAVFQSGCVIITGANKMEHIDTAYAFICSLLKDNMSKIKRNKLPLPPLPHKS